MSQKSSKIRLDSLMVERGLISSRQRAQALIMAGQVTVDGTMVEKPGKEVPFDANVSVKESLRYVSRGGLKLEAALDAFGVDPAGLRILDAGCSTGGFTDCLLQRGVIHVIAVDVGYGQFDWRLRSDSRVTLLERTNIRFLDPTALPFPVNAAVADLSFISLRLILPKLAEIVPVGGWTIPLIKPQFEVGKADVGKGGVVRDIQKIRNSVDRMKAFSETCGFRVLGEVESPISGPKGNREFLIHLVRVAS